MRVIATIVLVFTLSFVNAQNRDAIQKFFQNYSNDESFTSVLVTGKIFEMMSKIESTNPDFNDMKAAIKNIKYLNILTHEGNGVGYYKEALSKIDLKEYEPLMVVKGKEENVQFLTKTTGNVINELILLVGDKDDFALISFVGDLDLNMISKLANKVNVQHSDELKALEKAKK
jgi:hypothetical protein